MTALTITSYVAIYLALFYVVISMRIGLNRRKKRIAIGDGGDAEVNRLIRGHGNFSEYVPFALVLMILCELKSANYDAIMAAAILLCVGRTIHYYGLTKSKLIFRMVGMLGTMLSFVTMAIALLCALN